jgi:hypothetical protein
MLQIVKMMSIYSQNNNPGNIGNQYKLDMKGGFYAAALLF